MGRHIYYQDKLDQVSHWQWKSCRPEPARRLDWDKVLSLSFPALAMPDQTWRRVLGARLVYLLDWECMHYFSPCYNRIPDERTFKEEGCLWSHSVKTPEGKRGSVRARQLAAWHLQSESREQRRKQLLSSLPLYFVFSPVPQSMEWWYPHLEWVISPHFVQSGNSLINTPKVFSPSWVFILPNSQYNQLHGALFGFFFLITEKSLLQISSSADTGKRENRNPTLYTHLSLKGVFQDIPPFRNNSYRMSSKWWEESLTKEIMFEQLSLGWETNVGVCKESSRWRRQHMQQTWGGNNLDVLQK